MAANSMVWHLPMNLVIVLSEQLMEDYSIELRQAPAEPHQHRLFSVDRLVLHFGIDPPYHLPLRAIAANSFLVCVLSEISV